MRKLNIFKKAALVVTGLVVGLMVSSTPTLAIPYTGDNTQNSPIPAFNVFTGVPQGVGDEGDFLRARIPTGNSDSTTPYVDPLSAACTPGQRIQMRVYVHNGASEAGNEGGSGPSVAHDVKVKVNLDNTEAKAVFNPSANISAKNAVAVNDNATINCQGKTVKLKYQTGSASAYSIGTGVYPVDENLLFGAGAPIRSQSVPGDVWGCWNDRVYVVLSVLVEEVPPVVQPSIGDCKALENFAIDEKTRKVSFKVTGTVQNAQITGYKVDWGDGTVTETQDASHTYAKDSTYKIVASVRVKYANGTEEWKTLGACQREVTFKTATPPVVVTPVAKVTPTVMPKTGPADVMGLFAATSAGGALVHRYILSRRNRF